MTAEILIMNKSAIAMAADSAVTVGGRKTYNGVNKLFMLSNEPPMGIMMYASADFMDIPLESLIKEFRFEYGNELTNVNDFMSTFLNFIKEYALERRGNFEEYFSNKLDEIYLRIKSDNNLFGLIEDTPELVLSHLTDKIESSDYKKFFFEQYIMSKYDDYFDILVDRDFKDHDDEFKVIIREIYQKQYVWDQYNRTGIVIAGFNRDEIYPSYSSYYVYSIFDDTNTFFKEIDSESNYKFPIIAPFAQTDVVDNFLMGTNRKLVTDMQRFVKIIIDTYPQNIVQILKEDSDINQEYLDFFESKINDISEDNDELINLFNNFVNDNIRKSISPIFDSINALPKEELGNMCESLIHITSLKRKVDNDLESVGGDIDVAVISKGDGFIWVKRKHYFDPDLNSQFFKRKKFHNNI